MGEPARKLHGAPPAHHDDDHGGGHGGDHEEHEGGHGEPWLVSYADMMTLLFGFFVVMYTLAAAKNDDDTALVRVRKEVAAFFGGEYIDPLGKASQAFAKAIGGTILERNTEIKASPEGLEISFRSSTVFESGSAKLIDSSREALMVLAKMVVQDQSKARVVVEGHTDDRPIVGKEIAAKYPTNWELSTARAAAVVRLFEEAGHSPDKLVAIGYAGTRPVVPNKGEGGKPIDENRARNRRVTVKITAALDQTSETPAGETIEGQALQNAPE